jgi:hypothetical protein
MKNWKFSGELCAGFRFTLTVGECILASHSPVSSEVLKENVPAAQKEIPLSNPPPCGKERDLPEEKNQTKTFQ